MIQLVKSNMSYFYEGSEILIVKLYYWEYSNEMTGSAFFVWSNESTSDLYIVHSKGLIRIQVYLDPDRFLAFNLIYNNCLQILLIIILFLDFLNSHDLVLLVSLEETWFVRVYSLLAIIQAISAPPTHFKNSC